MKHNLNQKTIKVGEIVFVKGEYKWRGSWKIGRIDKLFVRNDGVIRSVHIKTAKGFIEQPVQLLDPVERHCNNITDDNQKELTMTKEGNTNGKLNHEASTVRPKRTAAAIASIELKDMTEGTDV